MTDSADKLDSVTNRGSTNPSFRKVSEFGAAKELSRNNITTQ